MSLHTFADFVNAIGPVLTDRFGTTSHNQVQVLSPDVFLLRTQVKDPETGLLAEGTRKIELSNIKTVQLETSNIGASFRGGTPKYIVFIFLKTR